MTSTERVLRGKVRRLRQTVWIATVVALVALGFAWALLHRGPCL